jgi:hypothetical protein
MKNYLSPPTDCTPGLSLNSEKNLLEITGESRPEDIREFYGPVLEWIDEYEKLVYYIVGTNNSPLTMELRFQLSYFNSSSAKVFIQIIQKLASITRSNSLIKLNIIWTYEEGDEDILDAGKEFEKITGSKMEFVKRKAGQ